MRSFGYGLSSIYVGATHTLTKDPFKLLPIHKPFSQSLLNVDQVIERANIHDVKGKVLVEFNESQGTFDFPRGRYSVEMYSHFMRMHGSRFGSFQFYVYSSRRIVSRLLGGLRFLNDMILHATFFVFSVKMGH